MAKLDTIDETKPDGATEPVSTLDNYERELRVAVRETFVVEHHLTGEHFFLSGNTASRPAFGKEGRLYNNTETKVLQRDTGAAWEDLIPYYHRTKVGTYTGDNTPNRAITGVGFQPTAVTVVPLSGTNPAFIKTVDFVAGDSHKLSDNTTVSTGIDTLDADGFTVDADANVNTVVYAYIAHRDRA